MSVVIEVRGLRLLGSHGALPGEQDVLQPFEIDLDVAVDGDGSRASDDLRDTVDYGLMIESASKVVSTTSYRLLEALSEAVAAAILSLPGTLSVTAVVRKLRPPIGADLASVGVRTERHRG